MLLGAYDGDRFVYVGQTDIGFTGGKLSEVLSRLVRLVRSECPFSEIPKVKGNVVWVEPEIVCQVRFSDWSKKGVMLHPVFLGVKNAKRALEHHRTSWPQTISSPRRYEYLL